MQTVCLDISQRCQEEDTHSEEWCPSCHANFYLHLDKYTA